MKLSDIFSKYVVTARPQDTLRFIAGRMQEFNIGMVVVVEDEHPVGIVTDRDLALALGAQGMPASAPVETVMTPNVLAIPDDTDVLTATKFIRERGVRRLPIVDRDDRLVGIVTLDDMLRYLSLELHNLTAGIEAEMEVK